MIGWAVVPLDRSRMQQTGSRFGNIDHEFRFRGVKFEDTLRHLGTDAQRAVGNDHNHYESKKTFHPVVVCYI